MTGTLWLVPNALDLGAEAVPIEDVLPLGVLRRAAALGHWVVEDARSARAFLKRVHAVVPLAQPLQNLEIRELPRPLKGAPTEPSARESRNARGAAVKASAADRRSAQRAATGAPSPWSALLAPALAGHDLGLLSEAGLPAVADPGAALVAAAHAASVPVQPLPGASSLLMALAASGLDGQHFAFVGYLPQDAAARAQRIRELEALALKTGQTQLFIETPYRNPALWQALLQTLKPGTRLAIGQGLTLADAHIQSRAVSAWQQARNADATLARAPAVFAIGP